MAAPLPWSLVATFILTNKSPWHVSGQDGYGRADESPMVSRYYLSLLIKTWHINMLLGEFTDIYINRCSNYIWEMNKFISYLQCDYIRGLTKCDIWHFISCERCIHFGFRHAKRSKYCDISRVVIGHFGWSHLTKQRYSKFIKAETFLRTFLIITVAADCVRLYITVIMKDQDANGQCLFKK